MTMTYVNMGFLYVRFIYQNLHKKGEEEKEGELISLDGIRGRR